MTLKKTFNLLIIFIFFITKMNAQFVGYYNLHDGGVDMPHSSLFVLSNNEFYFFYYGGLKTGKWNEVDKNNITLTETKIENDPISIYGKFDKNLNGIHLNVYGLYDSHAFINFSNDTIYKKEFQPVFNDGANCLGHNYQIKKKVGEYKTVTFSIAADPEFGSYKIRYPYKALLYSFPFDKKYNSYVVIQNEDAHNNNMDIKLSKKNEIYSIGGGRDLEREELTDQILKKVEKTKEEIDNEIHKRNLGTKIVSNSKEKIIIYNKPILKPLFISKCNDDEKSDSDNKSEKRILPTADRINGFYTILDFKEDEYDIKKYELAKDPSIKKEDISKVNKVVSDYGGYEIEIVFTENGSIKLAKLSKNNIRKPVAIVVNRLIVSCPVFASTITGGQVNITGDFSEIEVDEIIANLKK